MKKLVQYSDSNRFIAEGLSLISKFLVASISYLIAFRSYYMLEMGRYCDVLMYHNA